MNIEFSSSSMLQSPIVVDAEAQTAVLTFNSGKEYTYAIQDPAFIAGLQEIVSKRQSVGKFINAARAERRLTEV